MELEEAKVSSSVYDKAAVWATKRLHNLKPYSFIFEEFFIFLGKCSTNAPQRSDRVEWKQRKKCEAASN